MSREVVFKSSKWKALVLVVGAGLFVWAGFVMMSSRPLVGWAAVLFFGTCALMGVVLLLSGGASLHLDEEGFEMIGAFKRTRFLWRDVESIRINKIRGASLIAIDYKSGHSRRSQVSRSFAGMDTTIGNVYNVSLKELCATLNEWHDRYGSAT